MANEYMHFNKGGMNLTIYIKKNKTNNTIMQIS